MTFCGVGEPKLPDDVIRTIEMGETDAGDRYTIIIENVTAHGNNIYLRPGEVA